MNNKPEKTTSLPAQPEKKEWVAPELIEKSVKKTESGLGLGSTEGGGIGGNGRIFAANYQS